MSVLYVGIDPGLSGALSSIRADGSVFSWVHAPTKPEDGKKRIVDWRRVADWLEEQRRNADDIFVALEKAFVLPKQGIVSAFRFGGSYYGMVATLEIATIPYVIVRSQDWKSLILQGSVKRGKDSSIAFALRYWPELGTKPITHDVADSLCLAEYARRMREVTHGKV